MTKINEEILFLVINLDSQKDRWENCLKQAENYGLALTRVPACTPSGLSTTTYHYVTPGVRAVWESHMACIRYFLGTGFEYAIILEDDFNILNFKKIERHLQNPKVLQYDLVQFGFLKPGFDTTIKILIANVETLLFRFIAFVAKLPLLVPGDLRDRLRVKEAAEMPWGFTADDFQPGAHCYLVSREIAEAILNLNNPQFLCIDDFYTALSQMRSFKSLRIRKSLVGQAPFAKWEGDRFLKTL